MLITELELENMAVGYHYILNYFPVRFFCTLCISLYAGKDVNVKKKIDHKFILIDVVEIDLYFVRNDCIN